MSEHTKPKLFTEQSPLDPDRPYSAGDWRLVPEVVHDEQNVKGFFGDYRWLSNFGDAGIALDGFYYWSTERAYQAAKWRPEDRDFFRNCSNLESIEFNRENTPNGYSAEQWDGIKTNVMRNLLTQKFNPAFNLGNAVKLRATEGKHLEETNWWGDRFWGVDLEGNGLNTLGKLIMEIRDNA